MAKDVVYIFSINKKNESLLCDAIHDVMPTSQQTWKTAYPIKLVDCSIIGHWFSIGGTEKHSLYSQEMPVWVDS